MAMTKMIAFGGSRIRASEFIPGIISQITIKPVNNDASEVTRHTISFISSNVFSGKVRIDMPKGILLPKTVKGGKIVSENVIEMFGLSGLTPKFTISGVRNPVASGDAGRIRITTFNRVDGKEYVVDTGESEKSFEVI